MKVGCTKHTGFGLYSFALLALTSEDGLPVNPRRMYANEASKGEFILVQM